MPDTQSTPEAPPSLLNKFSCLKLKKIWIPLVIFPVIGVATFYGLNYYEHQNGCMLQLNSDFSIVNVYPISCEVIPFYGTRLQNSKQNNTEEVKGGIRFYDQTGVDLKPLILLYPENDTPVQVTLEHAPGFSATYPEYDNEIKGWSVLAHPDGTLYNNGTNQDTYGLFWEGNKHSSKYDLEKGFVIKGSDLRNFLYTKLTEIGLNTKEKSDFIMYWYPKLQEYSYIQITFAGKDYTDTAKLSISPTPDSLLRVFMVAKPLDSFQSIPEQQIEKFERIGFSVVEWGGTVVQ